MDIFHWTFLIITFLVLVKHVELRKSNHRIQGLDTSVILHALVSEDAEHTGHVSNGDQSISPIIGSKVEMVVNDARPSEESKNKKRHHKNKKRHNSSKNKGRKKSKQRKSCCENGGLCVLGSFCHCPKNFVGRYCEFRVKSRGCGPLKHEEVLRQGCTLCRCLDGVLHCIPKMYANCDDDQVDPIFFNFNQAAKANTRSKLTGDNQRSRDILKTLEDIASKGNIISKTMTTYIWLLFAVPILQRLIVF